MYGSGLLGFVGHGGDTGIVASNVVDRFLRGSEVIDEEATSARAHSDAGPILVKVGGGEGQLALDVHDLLLGLGVAADPLLVQAHGESQRVVNWAEGNACCRAKMGREAEQILVCVAIPKRDHSTLTTRPKQGGLK